MSNDSVVRWPVRSTLPSLSELDPTTLELVALFVDRLRSSMDAYGERVLALTRRHVPGYSVVSDDDIRASAQSSLDDLVGELSRLRTPNDTARDRLAGLAVRRAAQGVPLETLSLGYRLGSREMLAMMDEIAIDIGLPNELVLAMHDSTWEFANEAATVFARIEHDRAIDRVRFDIERRAASVGHILGGGLSIEDIHRDASLLGLDVRREYVPLAIHNPSPGKSGTVRRSLATALHTTPDRLLIAQVGEGLGCIASDAPDLSSLPPSNGLTCSVGPAGTLDGLADGFAEAQLALETALLFGISGVVRLHELGPKPLALGPSVAIVPLERRLWRAIDEAGRSGRDIAETARIYLECDQQAQAVARRLNVHANTVRYRIARFQELTQLDLRKTEDLITAWWILNRRQWQLP